MAADVDMDRLEWGNARADKVEVGIGQEQSKKVQFVAGTGSRQDAITASG
jgi:hypothetical protein